MLQTRISYKYITSELSARKFCAGPEMKLTSSLGGIQHAGASETASESVYCLFSVVVSDYKGRKRRRGKRDTIPRAPNHYGGADSLRGTPKSPNNVTSTFFNTVYLFPKDLRFERGGSKLDSCPGRHLTSLCP